MHSETPKALGYRMPAEWEPHEGTWLIWPHEDTYKDSQLHLEHIWLEMTRVLKESEIVHIIVPDEPRLDHLQHQLNYYQINESNIDFQIIANDDVWVRDCGPIFLINDSGDMVITSWNFNGWGERYPYQQDRNVPEEIAKKIGWKLFNAPITLEGGGIEVNGQGTFIATRSSIINPNRNPGMDQEELENTIKDYLGIDQIIWLTGASREFCDAVGSDTDMHIDGCARFVDESTVMYLWTDDESNLYYPHLKKHKEELGNALLPNGKKLTLIPLLKPKNKMYSTLGASTRPPFNNLSSLTTYANFYIANKVVLVPVYGDETDSTAKSLIAEHFPDRKIVGIPAWATAERGGMMHCVTQQQPLIQEKDKNMANMVNLGLIQMSCEEGIEKNFNKAVENIKIAAKNGAQIICTQELFKSPYFCQVEDPDNFKLAEEINEKNPTIKRFGELASELKIVLIASLFEKRAPGLFHNTAVVFDVDGNFLGKYRKMHIPDDPHYYEKFYFTPGDLGYKVFDTKFGRIGILICWDQWFPEAARLLGLQGVEIIFIPTAIGYSRAAEGTTYDSAWKTVQQGHAVANACFLAAVNRVGFELDPLYSDLKNQSDGVGPNGEKGINFWGQSFVADPDGVLLKEASINEEEILVCPIDLDQVDETKDLSSFPYRDRRVDSYHDLLLLYTDQ